MTLAFYLGTGCLTLGLALELSLHVAYAARNALVTRVPIPYVVGSAYGPVPPWVDGLRMLESDDDLIWKGRPGLRRTYVDVFGPARTEDDRASSLRRFRPAVPDHLADSPVWEIALNTDGFREREFPLTPKPAGTFRVVCLGDSWTFGANVGDAETYPRQLEARLRERFPEREVEVLNLGVLGYSSFQGLRVMERHGVGLEPDLVVIGYGMNDASVAGYRDRDVTGPWSPTWPERMAAIRGASETYRLATYWHELRAWEPPTPGDALATNAAAAAKPSDGPVDYAAMEPWTRVSPTDYRYNLTEMVRLARATGAEVVLLFNELWTTSPYRDVVAGVASETGAAFVDTAAYVRTTRERIARDVEVELGLTPEEPEPAVDTAAPVEVIFRVRATAEDVSDGMYIVGADPQLGALKPNRMAMRDDGAGADQRAGDGVWSFAARFDRGREIAYVYTVGGPSSEGAWMGLDVPHVRKVRADIDAPPRWHAPIDTFGRIYMQADSWHTNAKGYAGLSEKILATLGGREAVGSR